jgi:hypothetical protein
MKKLFLSILLATATSMSFGQGQGELTTTTTTTTTQGRVQKPPALNERPAAARIVPTEGAVQVAIRTGQPIQLINPAAPARFGNAQEHVSHDPNDPGKPKGIVLFAWSF